VLPESLIKTAAVTTAVALQPEEFITDACLKANINCRMPTTDYGEVTEQREFNIH